ncbi:MAG: hypothetical protein PVH88_06940 [Ignavibacteria bacterium]|jgi:hypothetical protein
MNKEEGTKILEAVYDKSAPKGSFQKLFEVTCDALTNFINYYKSRTKKFRSLSVIARIIAIIGGVIGLLLLNPLALTLVPEQFADYLTKEENKVFIAGIVAIVTGGILTLDFTFGYTRKYTNWNVTQFELLAEKAEFHAAFSERFMAKSPADMTTELFEEARNLSLDVVHEFAVKRAEETRIWAQNTQSAMQALRQTNQALQTSAKTAATMIRKKQEEEAIATEKKQSEKEVEEAAQAKPSGLSVEIKANGRQSIPDLRLKAFEISNGTSKEKERWSVDVAPGVAVSTFLPKGFYTVKLYNTVNPNVEICSKAVTLDKDVDISI